MLTNMAIAVLCSPSVPEHHHRASVARSALGHAAFLGAGAYSAALVTTSGLSFWVALPVAMATAALLGLVVGFASLRVRHDFLAITTMGVGFLFVGIVRKQEALGGELGIAGIPDPGLGKLGFLALVLGLVAAFTAFSLYLKRSWLGFVFEAVAEDEDTAAVLGIDVARYKLTAFVIGTAVAGLAGALYAHNIRFIGPDSFGFVESVTVLAMVVVGGIGSVWGVMVAAAVLTALPLWSDVMEDYKLLLYGAPAVRHHAIQRRMASPGYRAPFAGAPKRERST